VSQVDPGQLESETTAGDPLDALRGTRERHQRRMQQGYAAAQLEQGAVLSVAVIVRDEQAIDETRSAIEAAGRAAGLPLKAISWQQAVGLLGHFTTLIRAVLLAAVSIIFLVALWVINNALMLAAIQRVREIGTLRAVGAQRQFILGMLLLEATAIGLVSGACGTLLGALALQQLSRVGIPAVEDVLTFFFSGPRLYPRVEWPLLLFAMLCACSVSVVSSLYPAWLAMRVSPRQAMQTED
jgi:ABC-type lipoprotein release transport system permease subunit